jgi:AbrB family looped-hinge helix DNA binding protein
MKFYLPAIVAVAATPFPMALVSVKSNFHVVIPADVREAVGVEVGDLLEARVEAGKITLTPRSVVDRGIAESVADFAAGRCFGPFKSRKDLTDSLHRESSKIQSKTKPKRKSRK